MKLLWYITSILTIFLILINNPKTNSLSNFSNQNNLINFTSNDQSILRKIIIVNILFFLLLTIFSIVNI